MNALTPSWATDMTREHTLLTVLVSALVFSLFAQTVQPDTAATVELKKNDSATIVAPVISGVKVSSDSISLPIKNSTKQAYLTADTMLVRDKKVLSYLSRITTADFSSRDSIFVYRYTFSDASSRFKYCIYKNKTLLWDLTLALPSPDLEALFVQKKHNEQLDSAVSQHKKKERGFYQVSPWKSVPPIFKEKGLPSKMIDMFAWEAGAEVNFYRNHHYNFNKMPDDTTEFYVNLGRPALVDYRMDMEYVHRFGIFWLGTGIERSAQLSSRFDTLYVDRGGWFSRMGWNISMAVPGFRYKLYRDPGVIPYYSIYEDSIYNKLYPGAKYGFTKKIDVIKDSILKERTMQYGEVVMNFEDTVNRIQPLGGMAHELLVKAGYFNYQINIHPRAYILPIHTIGMVGLPFFKGEWAMKLIFLPNRKVIPHASVDFYRTSIPIGKNTLGISPLHIDLEVWDRSTFFGSLGFNVELLTKKATFIKESQ